MSVFVDQRTGKVTSRAGLPYALLWIVVVGARIYFAYGAQHVFTAQLVPVDDHQPHHRGRAHRRPDLPAVAMLLARTGALAARVRRVGARRADEAAAPVASLR